MVVKTAWTPLLHIRNPLPLHRPGVCDPHVTAYIIFSLLLQYVLSLMYDPSSKRPFLQISMLVRLSIFVKLRSTRQCLQRMGIVSVA